MDQLLLLLRRVGAQHLMVEAAAALNPDQRATAFAAAAEIMHSDGRLQQDKRNFLDNLGSVLKLNPDVHAGLIRAVGMLHGVVGYFSELLKRATPASSCRTGAATSISEPPRSPTSTGRWW